MPFAPRVSSRIEYVKTGITLMPADSSARIRASSMAQLDDAHETREKRIPTQGPLRERGVYQARYSATEANACGASGWYSPSHGTATGGITATSRPSTAFSI